MTTVIVMVHTDGGAMIDDRPGTKENKLLGESSKRFGFQGRNITP